MPSRLHTDCRLMTFQGDDGYGLIEDGALCTEGERIAWVGPRAEAPAAQETLSWGGRLLSPALIDCHTHLVFGGSRAWEFEARLGGKSYAQIAQAGGGILSTVRQTRAAAEATLRAGMLARADDLLADGVGTIEIKSGYGLDLETERRQLQVARSLPAHRQVRVVTSYLGAHAVPPEATDDPDGYIARIVEEVLPTLAAEGLVDAVDGFCETIAFSPAQMARVFDKAKALGLPVKLHADQLSDGGGAALAARYRALSADHVEYTSAAGVAAMAEAGTVAVLLPGAFFCLRETQPPPVQAFREAGVAIAVATDCNPGSSPVTSLLLTLAMACVLFRLTPAEALRGATVNAAKALGLLDRGQLAPGMLADLAVWDVEQPVELVHTLGHRPLHARIHAGEVVP